MIRIWTFLLSGLTIACVAMTMWLWLEPNIHKSALAVDSLLAQDARERVVSKFPSPSEADSLLMVEQAVSIRDPSKVASYFRMGTSSPQEVVEFLQGMESRDGAIQEYKWLSSVDANGLSLEGVIIKFVGGAKPRKRLALLTPDVGGKWQIDFDAFARKVTPSWEEFLVNGAASAQVRTYLAADSYYNGPFKDDSRWTCYGIATPDRDEVLLGYCKVGSPQAAAVKEILSKGAKTVRVFLEVRHVEGAESRQVEISRVLAEGWVATEKLFDERFAE